MKLSPDRTDAVSKALRDVVNKAADVTRTSDTETVRARLNETRFAVIKAYQMLNDFENDTRREALERLEREARERLEQAA